MPGAGTTATKADARLESAHRFRAQVIERAAERVVPLTWGAAVFHPGLPRLIDVNAVRVEVPAPDLTADALADQADRLQRSLPQRRIEIFDERTAHQVTADLIASGWQLDRSVLMAFEGPAPEGGDIAVEEVPYDIVAPLREEWLRGGPWGSTSDVLEQAAEGDRRMFTATPTRAFTAERRSYALLLEGDGTAMIEDVYTTPAERGRGLAGAVVARLVAEAQAGGADLVFLATDADGLAQHLYARLGFRPLGVVHRYLRTT